MRRLPPRSTPTHTLVPFTTLVRSSGLLRGRRGRGNGRLRSGGHRVGRLYLTARNHVAEHVNGKGAQIFGNGLVAPLQPVIGKHRRNGNGSTKRGPEIGRAHV